MTYHVFITTPRAGLGFAVAPYTVECKEVFATREIAEAFAAAKTLNAGVVSLFDAMPSLFPAWQPGTLQVPVAYVLGMRRSHNGGTWRCSLGHNAAGDMNWQPGGAANLWTREPNPGSSAWQVGVPYALPSQATHNGRLFQLVIGHTSQADWAPHLVPALWTDIGAASLVLPYTRAIWSVVSSDDPDYTEINRDKEPA